MRLPGCARAERAIAPFALLRSELARGGVEDHVETKVGGVETAAKPLRARPVLNAPAEAAAAVGAAVGALVG